MAEVTTNGKARVNGANGMAGTSSSPMTLRKVEKLADAIRVLIDNPITSDMLTLFQNYGELETTNMQNMRTICKIQNEVEALQIECAKKDEQIEEAKENVRQLKDRLKREKQATAAKTQELERAFQERNESKKRLELLEGFAVKTTTKPKDEITKYLDEIFTSAFKLVDGYFSQDLEGEALTGEKSSDKMRQLKLSEVPLPLSNSADAKRMRVATVLGHLGQAATRELFQPVYAAESDDIGELLEDMVDEDQADWLRRSLLMVDDDCQSSNKRRRAEAVTDEVSGLVSKILSPDRQKSFAEELDRWCIATADVWMKHLQPLRCKVIPFIDPVSQVTNAEEWETMMPTAEWKPPSDDKKEVVARIWPVFTTSDMDIVKRGLVVTRMQVAAAREEETSAMVQPAGSRRASRATRRSRRYSMSVGSEQAESFLVPGSPSPSGGGDDGGGGDGGGEPKAKDTTDKDGGESRPT